MSKFKIVTKSISIREDVLENAMKIADKYHGGNLSALITNLISNRYHDVNLVVNESKETSQGVSLVEDRQKKKIQEGIDNIINL